MTWGKGASLVAEPEIEKYKKNILYSGIMPKHRGEGRGGIADAGFGVRFGLAVRVYNDGLPYVTFCQKARNI